MATTSRSSVRASRRSASPSTSRRRRCPPTPTGTPTGTPSSLSASSASPTSSGRAGASWSSDGGGPPSPEGRGREPPADGHRPGGPGRRRRHRRPPSRRSHTRRRPRWCPRAWGGGRSLVRPPARPRLRGRPRRHLVTEHTAPPDRGSGGAGRPPRTAVVAVEFEEDAQIWRESSVPVLVEPGHLDRLQDALVRRLRVVREAGQLRYLVVQVGEPHGERVRVRISLAQGDRDLPGIPPGQAHTRPLRRSSREPCGRRVRTAGSRRRRRRPRPPGSPAANGASAPRRCPAGPLRPPPSWRGSPPPTGRSRGTSCRRTCHRSCAAGRCCSRARCPGSRSEEHTSELQSLAYLVCRLLLEKKKKINIKVKERSKKCG